MDELEMFSRLLDGETGEEERGEMMRTFAENPALREEWARWKAMDSLLRSIPAESPSPGFTEAVMGRIGTAPTGRKLWLWGLAWGGGVLLSGVLMAGVLLWYIAHHPAWITTAVAFALSGMQIVQTVVQVGSVWAVAMVAVLHGFAVPLAFGAAVYAILTMAALGAIVGQRHHHALRML